MSRCKQNLKSLNKIIFPELVMFIFCIELITFPSTYANVVSLLECDQAYLNFTFSCDIYEVVLQVGYKPPFYHSRNGGSLSLPPDQEERFIVDNENCSYSCSLNLTIKKVQKDDAGTYTCFVYKDPERVQEYIQIGIHVDFPPGNASCELSRQHQDGQWGSLLCTAPVGSLPGRIDCYQNGEMRPPLTKPVENDISLKQTISINYRYLVFCCSVTFKLPKDMCECSDYIFDPMKNQQLTGLRQACSSTPANSVLLSSTLSPSASYATKTTVSNKITSVSYRQTIESTPTDGLNSIAHVIWGSVVGFLVSIIIILAVAMKLRKNNYSAVNRGDTTEMQEIK